MNRLVFFFASFLVLLVPQIGAAEGGAVHGIRTGLHSDRTRLVLDLSRPLPYRLSTLADPYRLIVDLPQVSWRLDSPADTGRRGLVAGLRHGLRGPDGGRIIVRLAGPARVLQTLSLPPDAQGRHRLVIDLAQTDHGAFMAALAPPEPPAAPEAASAQADAPPSRPAAAPVPAERPTLQVPVRTIVIDPGHGGVDPGAIGAAGTYEKDLVLRYARALRQRIEDAGGFRVLLTRDDDRFLSLARRVAIARQADADLFISIHADSIGNSNMRGGGIYTLSEQASDAETAALAARENRADLIGGVDLASTDDEVASILIDLVQRETMNYSARFANIVVDELSERQLRVRGRPHRFAGFRVLKAPDVPSVLVELGYLSNREEERYLLSQRGRDAVTSALASVVARYFSEIRN